jgi:hypothetical protein
MGWSRQFDTVARIEVWDGTTRHETYHATHRDPDEAVRLAMNTMLPDVREDFVGAALVLPREQWKARAIGDVFDFVIHADLVC